MRYDRVICLVGALAIGLAMMFGGRPAPIAADGHDRSQPDRDAGQGSAASRIATAAPSDSTKGRPMKKATFGAGCFWGVEATFRRIPGVIDAAVGYAGGHTTDPTYKEVCTDRTGHAEVVQVEYDPSKVSYHKLLEVFWSSHDPTQVNRQGPDYGTQYRTVIFYHDDEQKAEAEASKQKLDASHRFSAPIATQIVPAGPFYRAEEYHQRYLEKRGLENCHI
jgi:peptide-methionine (S)-S-oxide reductase